MVFEKIWKFEKNTKNVLSISPRIVKIRVGGWYHSIQHWMYFLGSIGPYAGFFIFPTFLMVVEKNLKIWKKYKKCFVDFSTYSKDTSGGLVPFDSALNVLPKGYSPLRWVFFPTFFDGFWKNLKIWKKYKNVLSISPRIVKIRVGGWYHSIQHWMYFLGGITPHAGFFVFPTFFMGFEKNLKIWKKYKKCFLDFSTYSKDTSGGLVPFDSALNVLPREYSPHAGILFCRLFSWFLKRKVMNLAEATV